MLRRMLRRREAGLLDGPHHMAVNGLVDEHLTSKSESVDRTSFASSPTELLLDSTGHQNEIVHEETTERPLDRTSPQ